MKLSAQLVRVKRAIDVVNTKTSHGTAATPKVSPRVDLASDRAQDRAGGGSLPTPTRGGTSSPSAKEERDEAERVKRQAEKDWRDLEQLVATMYDAATKIERIVDRQVETVHPSKLPTNVLPGCRACARKELDNEVTIGGHFEDVYADGLCRACWDFKSATGGLPPIKWCHLRHTEGRKAPNLWLAKSFPKLLRDVQRKKESTARLVIPTEPEVLPQCAALWWHHGTEVQCVRPQGHEPGCRTVVEGKSIPFPIPVAS